MKKLEKATPQTTVGEAKEFLRQNFKEGAICPCCRGVVKLYKRSITSSMAWGLILLSKESNELKLRNEEEEIHLETFFKKINVPASVRGDIPKLMFWELIHRTEGFSKKGYYWVTPKGHDFVNGKITVPEYIEVYNNKAYKQSDKHVSISKALKNKFDYNKLMEI